MKCDTACQNHFIAARNPCPDLKIIAISKNAIEDTCQTALQSTLLYCTTICNYSDIPYQIPFLHHRLRIIPIAKCSTDHDISFPKAKKEF